MTVTHDTIVLTRTYAATPARVFAALADPEARKRWGAPSDTAEIAYDATDFRVGGVDLSRCGGRGDLRFNVANRYLDIVANRRIISSETVADGNHLLSVSLITTELAPAGSDTRLTLTVQIAAFEGRGMIEGNRAGYTAALDNLGREVHSPALIPDRKASQ